MSRFVWMGALFSGALATTTALAQTAPAPAAPAPAAPAPAAPAAPAAPPSVTLLAPGMNGPLAFPSQPYSIDVGPLGKWYIDGALTGLGLWQDNRTAVDHATYGDLSNGQIFIQKVDGWWQFFVQAGGYSIPALGAAYTPNDLVHSWGDYYTALPQAFLKLQPTDNFYIEGGKLPTLIGAESTFTFENLNIERGLLWGQEPAVSRGVQAGLTEGPLTFALSLNDGYYSDRFNWLSGSAAWTINSANTLTFAAGGNLGHTGTSALRTPFFQNNSSIYNLIYTYNSAPVIFTAYFQYQNVPTNTQLGIAQGADSWGIGLLANYAFTSNFNLAGRFEYISTSGSSAQGTPNLLYGPGSNAYSFTITPTFIFDKFFIRGEGSVVTAGSVTPGDVFGTSGTKDTQFRGLLEGGIVF